jgi:hypothetical protein
VGWSIPISTFRRDLISEVSAGLNVGAWRRVRAQLEVAWQGAQRNTPVLFDVEDRVAVVGQIGAKF